LGLEINVAAYGKLLLPWISFFKFWIHIFKQRVNMHELFIVCMYIVYLHWTFAQCESLSCTFLLSINHYYFTYDYLFCQIIYFSRLSLRRWCNEKNENIVCIGQLHYTIKTRITIGLLAKWLNTASTIGLGPKCNNSVWRTMVILVFFESVIHC
jgi:hypothetical protein